MYRGVLILGGLGIEVVLISGGWSRGVPLCTSLQGVGIEGVHCVQRCIHFRELGSTVYRGVFISEGLE